MNIEYFISPEVEKKNQRKSAVATAIIMLLLLIFFLLVGFRGPYPPPPEEGIFINFGTSEYGRGFEEPTLQEAVSNPVAPTDNSPEVVEEVDMTSDVAAVPIEKEQTNTEAETPVKVEKPKPKPELEEIVREKTKIMEEHLFNPNEQKTTTSESQGDYIYEGGNQGDLSGTTGPHIKGENKGLADKGFGKLDLGSRGWSSRPSLEEYHQVEDLLILKISVDKEGNILTAEVSRGSTLVDNYLIGRAIAAVKRAKVTPDPQAPPTQIGTVTFNFRLR